MIPHILWTFWFGGNITNDFAHGSRSNNLERLIAGLESKIDHRHITSENLHLINVPNHPIHPQIFLPYLSGIHKSDYMRNYVMYHYGGAYADIKENTMLTWSPYFEDVLPNTWVYGQQEITTIDIACHPQTLKVQLGILNASCATIRARYKQLVSNGAFICRRHNPISKIIVDANDKRLDTVAYQLKRHPAPSSRCCFSHDNGYPLRWAELQGEKFHPLSVKFNNHVQISKIGFHF